MGQQANAYLVFGISIEHSQVKKLPWAPFGGKKHKLYFEDWVASINGLVHPYESADTGVSYREWSAVPANDELIGEHSKRYHEFLQECPIDQLCLDEDNQTLFIAIRTSVTRGDWNRPTEVTKLSLSEDEVSAAVSFCEAQGIPFETPRWMLLASYG